MPKVPKLAMKSFTQPKQVRATGLPPVSLTQSQQDQKNAPYFAAYYKDHPGSVAPAGTPGVVPPPPAPSGFSPGIQGLYDQTLSGIAGGLKSTTGGITAAEDRGASDYGYTVKYKPTVGPNGEREVDTITVDPANPFSRAALLQRSYDNAKRGSTNSYAASGQLYSGSLQNAQNENTRGFLQGDNTLRQGFSDFILGKEGERTGAVTAAGAAGTSAYGTALSQQLATTPEDPGKTVKTPAEKAASTAAMKARVKARLLAEARARKAAR